MQSPLLISTSQEGSKRGRKCELKGVELGNEARCFLLIGSGERSMTGALGQQGLPGRALGWTERHWDLNGSLCGSQFGLIIHRLSWGPKTPSVCLFIFNFSVCFFTGVWLLNNVVVVSAVKTTWIGYMCTYILSSWTSLPPTPHPSSQASRSSLSTGLSSLCHISSFLLASSLYRWWFIYVSATPQTLTPCSLVLGLLPCGVGYPGQAVFKGSQV